MARVQLNSLLLVEERLLEAEYFVRRLPRLASYPFGFELNAFLSAARSVTWVLQKQMAHVSGFPSWWEERQDEMRADEAMAFFLQLRNVSQKQGKVSLEGFTATNSRRWSHRFVSGTLKVPPSLTDEDVVNACRTHLAKLARVVLQAAKRFPYDACPRQALTPEGVTALGLVLEDVEETLGLPIGWSSAGGTATLEQRLWMLRYDVDGVDFDEIRRVSRLRPRKAPQRDPEMAELDGLLRMIVSRGRPSQNE